MSITFKPVDPSVTLHAFSEFPTARITFTEPEHHRIVTRHYQVEFDGNVRFTDIEKAYNEEVLAWTQKGFGRQFKGMDAREGREIKIIEDVHHQTLPTTSRGMIYSADHYRLAMFQPHPGFRVAVYRFRPVHENIDQINMRSLKLPKGVMVIDGQPYIFVIEKALTIARDFNVNWWAIENELKAKFLELFPVYGFTEVEFVMIPAYTEKGIVNVLNLAARAGSMGFSQAQTVKYYRGPVDQLDMVGLAVYRGEA